MRERWKCVKGLRYYMVSDHGRVRSLDRVDTNGRIRFGRILKLIECNRYLFVILNNSGRKHYKEVHRIVAIAWVANRKNLPKVNHLDRNKRNNHYKNLEWCNDRENASYHALSIEHKTSKYVGVSWEKRVSKWKTQIQIDGYKYHLGYFSGEKDAANMYNDFLKFHNLFNKYSKL